MWLWAKYVTSFNPKYHCTNCIRGHYSKVLSKPQNRELANQGTLNLDEFPRGSYRAIYICGVAKQGYSAKRNYPVNLHAVIRPEPGATDEFVFLEWRLRTENGVFLPIPAEARLPQQFRTLPPEFTTCRIFRWASVYFARPT